MSVRRSAVKLRSQINVLGLGQVSSSPGVMVAGAHVKFSDAVKLLGMTLDSALTLDKHITNITPCCYHIRVLRHIHPLLKY